MSIETEQASEPLLIPFKPSTFTRDVHAGVLSSKICLPLNRRADRNRSFGYGDPVGQGGDPLGIAQGLGQLKAGQLGIGSNRPALLDTDKRHLQTIGVLYELERRSLTRT